MSLTVVWAPQAHTALTRIHWRTASDIDAAILRYARVGARPSNPPFTRLRLRAAGHDALLVIDRDADALHVIGLYRVG